MSFRSGAVDWGREEEGSFVSFDVSGMVLKANSLLATDDQHQQLKKEKAWRWTWVMVMV